MSEIFLDKGLIGLICSYFSSNNQWAWICIAVEVACPN